MSTESPLKYAESEVTLQYRRPVRNEVKELLSEEELARRQAEAMRRIYQEERRRKYLAELHDISSRRHTDNFTWVQTWQSLDTQIRVDWSRLIQYIFLDT